MRRWNKKRDNGPLLLYVYVYTVANHLPWDKRWRPEVAADWHELGNRLDVDEYIDAQPGAALLRGGSENHFSVPAGIFLLQSISRGLSRDSIQLIDVFGKALALRIQ